MIFNKIFFTASACLVTRRAVHTTWSLHHTKMSPKYGHSHHDNHSGCSHDHHDVTMPIVPLHQSRDHHDVATPIPLHQSRGSLGANKETRAMAFKRFLFPLLDIENEVKPAELREIICNMTQQFGLCFTILGGISSSALLSGALASASIAETPSVISTSAVSSLLSCVGVDGVWDTPYAHIFYVTSLFCSLQGLLGSVLFLAHANAMPLACIRTMMRERAVRCSLRPLIAVGPQHDGLDAGPLRRLVGPRRGLHCPRGRPRRGRPCVCDAHNCGVPHKHADGSPAPHHLAGSRRSPCQESIGYHLK